MSFKPKILLVDDNEVLRKLCYDYLVPEGYTLFEASNGRAAVETALRELPQVIILDIIMPVMDGLETCRILRGEEKLRNTCIMFLSTRDEVPDRVRGLDTGAERVSWKTVRSQGTGGAGQGADADSPASVRTGREQPEVIPAFHHRLSDRAFQYEAFLLGSGEDVPAGR